MFGKKKVFKDRYIIAVKDYEATVGKLKTAPSLFRTPEKLT